MYTFRLDDISHSMDWKKFQQAKDIFDKYNIKPLIGVIPDSRDKKLILGSEKPDFWEFILQLQSKGWTVAQHGCHHEYVTKRGGILKINFKSEFAGLSYETQYKKLKKGKNIMGRNGVFTDIFMAPAHTYDKNTIKALKKLGFKYVTDGLTTKPYIYNGIKFIPCKHWGLYECEGLSTICLHPNTMNSKGFRNLERIVEQHRKEIINFDEALLVDGDNRFWFAQQTYGIIKVLFDKFNK